MKTENSAHGFTEGSETPDKPNTMENLTKEQAITCPITKKDCSLPLCNSEFCGYQSTVKISGSVAAPKEEPKEESENLLAMMSAVLNELARHCDAHTLPSTIEYLIDKGYKLSLQGIGHLGKLDKAESELSSLRDQLRQRDELIKKLLVIAGYGRFELEKDPEKTHVVEEWNTIINEANSLIKKSQKL